MSNVLYVTSFTSDMYKVSGKKMIETFQKYHPNNKMVVCYEKMKLRDLGDLSDNILTYDLNKSDFLKKWLFKNRDIIPFYMGGLATPQNNSKLLKNEFNRQASCFFRKIVSIDYAISSYGKKYNSIVWMDADSYFMKNIPNKTISKIFSKSHVFFHLGTKRQKANLGIESGIIGFKNGNGYKFFKIVANKFRNGSFRQYEKWDDGYVFRKVWEEVVKFNKKYPNNPYKILFNDVVSHIVKSDRNEVIPYGPFKDYVTHEKGKHKRMGIRV